VIVEPSESTTVSRGSGSGPAGLVPGTEPRTTASLPPASTDASPASSPSNSAHSGRSGHGAPPVERAGVRIARGTGGLGGTSGPAAGWDSRHISSPFATPNDTAIDSTNKMARTRII